jgi:RES domain-containing protein
VLIFGKAKLQFRHSVDFRWTRHGIRLRYMAGWCCQSISICNDLMPNDFFSFAVSIPDEKTVLERLDPSQLSDNWRVQCLPLSCQQAGNEWLAHGKSAILSAPSVLIPGEWNFLLNPIHKDFKRYVVSPLQSFQFDYRLWS